MQRRTGQRPDGMGIKPGALTPAETTSPDTCRETLARCLGWHHEEAPIGAIGGHCFAGCRKKATLTRSLACVCTRLCRRYTPEAVLRRFLVRVLRWWDISHAVESEIVLERGTGSGMGRYTMGVVTSPGEGV